MLKNSFVKSFYQLHSATKDKTDTRKARQLPFPWVETSKHPIFENNYAILSFGKNSCCRKTQKETSENCRAIFQDKNFFKKEGSTSFPPETVSKKVAQCRTKRRSIAKLLKKALMGPTG